MILVSILIAVKQLSLNIAMCKMLLYFSLIQQKVNLIFHTIDKKFAIALRTSWLAYALP